MSEAPREPAPSGGGNDWLNRIIGLVIALSCLAFGLTLLVGAVDSVFGVVGEGGFPSVWVVLSVLLGAGLSALGGMFAWKSIMAGRAK